MKTLRVTTSARRLFLFSCVFASAAAWGFSLPVVDLSNDTKRHVIVAQGTKDVYQGHPTTVLMPDGKTIYCVWTRDHAGPCGPLKRSDDGGLTWSDLLPTPDSWRRVKNCPTIWRLRDPQGVWRLVVYAGSGSDFESSGNLGQKGMLRSVSLDGGKTWDAMRDLGLKPAPMPVCTIEPIEGGKVLLGMTNTRRPGQKIEGKKKSNVIAKSYSRDGGLTWSDWETVLDIPDLIPCEPWLVRSPDGKQLLCLMRENMRRIALKMTSDDEGKTWSNATPLPSGLRGDRHVAKYLPDGRLIVCFRDKEKDSPTLNHFVAWVGRYEDILAGRESGYRIKLLHSHKGGDCGYPGVEILPDGTVVATTYVKYAEGPEKNSVVSVRFAVDETDKLVKNELVKLMKKKKA